MKYTIHQLEVLCKVAEQQSVTKAAEELHMTQPAVSIQLKNLQNQFSVPLTEIIGRRIFLTEFGHKVAEKGRRIIAEMNEIKHMTSLYEGVLAGELKISSASTGKYVLPYFLSAFSKMYPEVNIQLDVTNKTQVMKSLEENKIDFAFISVIPEDVKVNSFEVLPNTLYLVGPKETEVEIKNVKDLEKVRLLYREEGSATRKAMEHYIIKHNLNISRTIELTSNEAVKQSIMAGLGYSIVPLIGLKNEIKNEQLKIISLKGLPIQTAWYVTWTKQKKLTPVMEAFLNFFKEHGEQIKSDKFDWAEE
jgi:DNA-binding transcriptional LysR family regulator